MRGALAIACWSFGCGELLGFGGLEFDRTECASGSPECGSAGSVQPAAGASEPGGGRAGESGAGGERDTGGSAGAGEVIECTTHAQCVAEHLGEPHVCRDARCIPLKNYGTDRTGDCRVVLGGQNLHHEHIEPFVFGALSLIDPISPETSPATLNYKLAVEEFSEQGGIRIGGKSRLPVAVICDESPDDPEGLQRSVDHLVDTVGVQAIIFASASFALKTSFERLRSRKKDVFMISPFAFTDAVKNIDAGATSSSPGLLWHLLPKPSDVARTYVPLVERAEAHLIRTSAEPPLRLALVESGGSTEYSELATFLDAELRFNGTTALDNPSTQYLRIELGPDHPGALSTLKAFRPHIVVSAATHEFVPVLTQLETAVNDGDVDPRPFYVLSPYQSSDPRLLGVISAFPGLRERVAGVNYASAARADVYDAYLSSLSARFPEGGNLVSTENFYDAPYYLLYAASAGGSMPGVGEVTGFDIANGMWRLLGDEPEYVVGPNDIPNALAYLAEDPTRTIQLRGALGPPDFDPFTGGRRGVGTVWCVDYDPESYRFLIAFDTLRLDPDAEPALSTLTGTFSCFPDF